MAKTKFVVCVHNSGYKVSLEPRKLYEVIPDPVAEKHGQIRVVDESGDDYLYPASFFRRISLPTKTAAEVAKAA